MDVAALHDLLFSQLSAVHIDGVAGQPQIMFHPDLGRVLEPELPPDWAPLIKAINEGRATKVRVTDRGAEFIAICRAKLVSDDRVAQMVFTNEGDMDEQAKALSDKYMKELRDRARIVKR